LNDYGGGLAECAEVWDLLRRRRVYADGVHVSYRRREKAALLAAALREYAPARPGLRACDFGCADAAIPKLLLESDVGPRLEEYVGITLLNYNQQSPKRFHEHPRLTVRIGDLEQPVQRVLPDLEPASFDVITATGFFHYLERPERALENAAWLLRPGGILLTMTPVDWLLRLRQSRLLPASQRNRTIRQALSPAAFLPRAAAVGFTLRRATRVQLTGLGWAPVRWFEQALSRAGLLARLGTNYFFVHILA
jgi:SAM-dependent methyltransferase